MFSMRLFRFGQNLLPGIGINIFRPSPATHNAVNRASFSTSTAVKHGTVDQQREVDDLIDKMEILLKGHDPAVMDSYEKFVSMVSLELNLPMRVEDRNRPHFVRLTLNRSPFVHKKHMRQYEFRTYCKTLYFNQLTGSTASVFLEYIQRNLPEGMAMQVRKERLEPLTEFIHKLNGNDTVTTTDSSKKA